VAGLQSQQGVLPWAVTILLHAGLGSLLWVVPPPKSPAAELPPVEIVDRRPPPVEKPRPPGRDKPEAPRPTEIPTHIAVPRKPAPRLPPRLEPPPDKEPPANEQTPEDTGPKTFGFEGGTIAAPGQGVPIPQGGSMRVSPQVTKKGKAPEKKTTGFKTEYAPGEEAPVAVITAYPKVLKRINADYPERMKELGIEGKVDLELTVSSAGKVVAAKVVKSLHPELDKVALAAVRQMLFSPALMGRTPVQVKINYTYTFVLD
jgi:TonB family protein